MTPIEGKLRNVASEVLTAHRLVVRLMPIEQKAKVLEITFANQFRQAFE